MASLSSRQEEFTGELFKDLEFEEKEIGGRRFTDCQFVRCNFAQTRFKGCRFQDCTFRDCTLNLMDVTDCSFIAVTFKNSQVVGVDWTQALWGKAGLLNSIAFNNCAINYSTFIGLNLRRIEIKDCIARDVDFTEANLASASFTGTDLTDSRFVQTDLTEADFTGATRYTINATLNTLKQTKFSLPEAMSLLYSLDIVLSE